MPASQSPELSPIRFILLGGFLGAGKTTALARLARHYQAQGRNVALVTNDKAADLVDTLNLRGQGFHVGELPGVCFCGNVDELVDMVDALGTAKRPDVVLAEPVGSCLDMVATVIRPLEQSYGRRFEVAPYGVLLKPMHAAKILRTEPNAGVAPKADYLFRQQLAEADFIAINRADRLSQEEIADLTRLVVEHYPHAPVTAVSAATGLGFDALLELLDRRGSFARRVVPLDYEAYGAGEAELGWFNGTFLVTSENAFDVDRFLLDVVGGIGSGLQTANAAVAHLKAVALWQGRHAAVNLVDRDLAPELSHASQATAEQIQLVVNARVACSPETLQVEVRRGLQDAAARLPGKLQTVGIQCFRPGMPMQSARLPDCW